ncbi:aBC-type transport system permease and ATPase components [Firmicutes bacterium CAG:313]|nr:aBC-type transport system permease and ATPase components [Firmicutes bacterium CAG:313]
MAHIYEKNDRHMSDREIIKRTWPYVKPYAKKIGLVLFVMLIMIVLELLGVTLPGYVTSSLGNLVKEFSDGSIRLSNMQKVFEICMAVLIVNLANSLLLYITTMSLQRIGQSIIYDLRIMVFEHIDNMSIAQINEIPVGTLVTRVTSDTNALSDLFTNTIVQLIKNLLLLIGVIVVMYLIDWRMASIMMLFLPIIAISSLIFRKLSRSNYRRVRKSFSVMNAFLNENISGMKITQIFNQEKQKEAEFKRLNAEIVKTRKTDIKIFATYRPFITLLYYAAFALVFGYGTYFCICYGIVAWPLLGSYISLSVIGIIEIFYSLVGRFFNPIQTLADQLNALQKAFTSCERLYNLLDIKPDFRNRENALEIEHFNGDIEFKNVWFAYKEGEWILKDVSLHIKPKQVVAFVGATGAGKTTILQLIVRNYDIQKGQILIDGIDIRDIDIKCLRRGIGQMLQDVFLFSGSIKSNINLRDDSIPDADIVEACKYVNADQFIDKLPKGLDEEVLEGGNNFSSGQRQLLSFARTVVHHPQILILDEATANIDTETEKIIQDSLLKMMNIGTMLIVAHRLSTIQHADNIICLQKGQIIEQGNHQDLLKQKGYYYNLYRLQYEDQEITNEN